MTPDQLAWLGPEHQPLWMCTPLRPVGPIAELSNQDNEKA